MFNHILEGVRRTGGIAKKTHYGGKLNIKEIKTLDILLEFIGDDVDIIITNIVKDIYAKQKEDNQGPTSFEGKDYFKKEIFTVKSKIGTLERKSFLYKTKVEYGNWTINHVVGCIMVVNSLVML